MDVKKPLEFHGTAGGYFIVTIVSLVGAYVPFFGWAFVLNFVSEWFADNALVNGRKVTYHAGYGESLKFVTVNFLLVLVTLGIYSFWFYPKAYRYMFDHTQYADAASSAAAPSAEAQAAVAQSPAGPSTPAVG